MANRGNWDFAAEGKFISKSMLKVLKIFTSLKLTIWLFSLSLALIFFGTLDHVQYGILHAEEHYFRSFLAIWSFPEDWSAYNYFKWLYIPMPGGYLLGGLLLINFIAIHSYHFQYNWKKAGILLIHSGLVLLISSEIFTNSFTKKTRMIIDSGNRSNYSQSNRDFELVFIDRSHASYDQVHSLPVNNLIADKLTEVIETPLKIKIINYYPNSIVGRVGDETLINEANRGIAKTGLFAKPIEIGYTDFEPNTASAYVEVLGPDGSLGTWLVSSVIDDRFPVQIVELGDRSWEIALRFKRVYYPFEIELLKFSYNNYPGTENPHNISSEIFIYNEDTSKNRKALISINHPMRYEGLTFYQSSVANQNQRTILQIVRNPRRALPYFSAFLIGAGLVLQFSIQFKKFLHNHLAIK